MTGPMDPAALNALIAVTSVPKLDLDTIGKAVNAMIQAVSKQAAALRKAKYQDRTVACPACETPVPVGIDIGVVAKAAAHCAKVTDELSRLAAFAQKGHDGQAGAGSRDLLAELDDEALAFVTALLAGHRGARAALEAWAK